MTHPLIIPDRMRLFAHRNHALVADRPLVPPPSMWRELRDRLDRLAHDNGANGRLRVQGRVDVPESEVSCSLCIVVDGEPRRVRDIRENGRFRLDLPAQAHVRLVFVQPGFLPRVVEIRPRTNAGRGTRSQRLDLHVSLTRSAIFGGAHLPPLRERITLGHGRVPMVVEYDRASRTSRQNDPWPLLKRAS